MENVEKGFIKMEFCDTNNQIANILTKPLNRERHKKMRLELGMIKLNGMFSKFQDMASQEKLEENLVSLINLV